MADVGGAPPGMGTEMPNDNPDRMEQMAVGMARRQAMRKAAHPPTIKHGLIAQPHIQHPRSGRASVGPSFGLGGGFKAGGF